MGAAAHRSDSLRVLGKFPASPGVISTFLFKAHIYLNKQERRHIEVS